MSFLNFVVGLRNNPHKNIPIDYVYDIDGNYYDPQSLTRVNALPEPILDIHTIDISKLTSEPVVICTLYDSAILVTDDNNNIQILSKSSTEIETEPMIFHMMFRVPNMALYCGRIDLPNQLELIKLPIFKQNIWNTITQYVNMGSSLQSTLTFIQNNIMKNASHYGSIESLSNTEILKLREILLSYETFMKHTSGIPVTLPQFLMVNGIRLDFISFQQITEMISQGIIERFIIDPILQPWAGNLNEGNRILTMFAKNGISYLVKAKYNPITNHIFSP